MKVIAPIFTLVLSLALSSCALFSNQPRNTDCQNAPYLYSDLHKKPKERTYHLPDGRTCSNLDRGIL